MSRQPYENGEHHTMYNNGHNACDRAGLGMNSMRDGHHFSIFGGGNPMVVGLAVIAFISVIILTLVISNDATKRGKNGLFWGLFTLVLPFLALPVYIIINMSEKQVSSTQESSNVRKQIIRPTMAVSKPVQYRVDTTPQQVVKEIPVERVKETPVIETTQTSDIFDMPINEVTKTDVQFCTTCGAKNSMSAIYCNKCGNKVVS